MAISIDISGYIGHKPGLIVHCAPPALSVDDGVNISKSEIKPAALSHPEAPK